MDADTLSFRSDMEPEDIVRLKNVLLSTEVFTYKEIKVALELILERLTRGDNSCYYFLIAEKLKHQVLGYTCFGPIACAPGRFDVYWIAVHAGYQYSGIGKLLLKKSEQTMLSLGARRVFIETSSRKQYNNARQFYLDNGYTIAAEVERFYSDNDNKIIFVKSIK